MIVIVFVKKLAPLDPEMICKAECQAVESICDASIVVLFNGASNSCAGADHTVAMAAPLGGDNDVSFATIFGTFFNC